MKKRVLIVEDDRALREVLFHTLVAEGFDVRSIGDGALATDAILTFRPDLVLLDIMLPGRNGFALCAEWRRAHSFSVIIITARVRRADELRGLQLGADDYVTKPFDLETLVARVQAVLRRTRPAVEKLSLGQVEIDFTHFTAHCSHATIDLTRQDFELLRYLAQRPHTIVYRDELLREVWGHSTERYTRAVDKAIARLRKKIEADPHHPVFIHTAHGDGYYLTADTK